MVGVAGRLGGGVGFWRMDGFLANRAVSALFRVWGGAGGRLCGEEVLRTGGGAMHGGERWFLAVLVPLTVWVGVGEGLVRGLGIWLGLVLAVPLGFLAMNVLPFLLGGRSPAWQWRVWLVAALVWAWWRWDAGGVVGGLARVWVVVAVLNALACVILALGATMRWSGWAGVWWRMFLLGGGHVVAVWAGWRYGWGWAVAGGGVMAGLYCLAVLRPGCQWLGPVRRRSGGREIWITIDDGPDAGDTPALLDLLDEHGRKAVFFVIGEKVRAHPELVREIVRRGHEVGNHTMTHPQGTFWCAGPWRTLREMRECQEVVFEACGVRPRWFRAPVGHRNWFTHPWAAVLGLEVMGWSRRGFDAVERDAAVVLERIVPGMEAGDIVLVHEGTPIAKEVLAGVLGGVRVGEGGQLERVGKVER